MTILMTLALLTTATVATQDYERLLQKKLGARFLSHAPWITDYEKALAKSEELGKPIFAYFSRSYSP